MKNYFNGFKKGIKNFGIPIATLVNSLILSAVYFFGLGLSFIVAKSLKKSLLDLEIKNNAESYWQNLDLDCSSAENNYRQF